MKKEILRVVELVHDDQFELTNIEKVFEQVKTLFEDNE
jgi:hypothetical protein